MQIEQKLKTLQDIRHPQGLELPYLDWYKAELKKEVIKWIKADKSYFYSREGMEETKLWIKHFFNIIEEDLK